MPHTTDASSPPRTPDQSLTDKDERQALQSELARLQRALLKTPASLLIVVDGWESSGKGRLIRDLVKALDPRFCHVRVIDPPDEAERRHSPLRRFWLTLPRHGQIAILNRSWYSDLFNDPKADDDVVARHLETYTAFETTLTNDDVIVLKLFIEQSKVDLRANVDTLAHDKNRAFLIDARDLDQVKHHKRYARHFRRVLDLAKAYGHPWIEIESHDRKPDACTALTAVIEAVHNKLRDYESRVEPDTVALGATKAIVSTLDLSPTFDDEAYDRELDQLQDEAADCLYALYTARIAAIVAFEGTDAAGKGGAIKRLVAHMDPRAYAIATTAAPDATERTYNHLWRFMRDMPCDGRLCIFDRTWYGRVLVERIEKLTPPRRWQQAYEEINAFERQLTDAGRMLIKILLVIDKDEQKIRFEARQNDPDKAYKLTDEDWRNRDKFDQYTAAMDDMVALTSTENAPWIVIPATDKRYARIAVLKAFIHHARAALKRHDQVKDKKDKDKTQKA